MDIEPNISRASAIPSAAIEQQQVADEALDKMEKLTAEDINQKYYDHLVQINASEGSGTSKDRMARMAQIVASKSLMI